jgi:hypothetical protein
LLVLKSDRKTNNTHDSSLPVVRLSSPFVRRFVLFLSTKSVRTNEEMIKFSLKYKYYKLCVV